MTAAMPDNKARARAFWTELFNAHDLRNVRGYFAPEFINHNARPGTPDGPEGAGQVFTRLWAGCPDMHFDLQEMVAEGSKVVCIGMMTGTHDGPFHGLPATHRPTAARQIHVLTFNDTGLITEHLARLHATTSPYSGSIIRVIEDLSLPFARITPDTR